MDRPSQWPRFLTRQAQFTLDILVLVAAFVLAYELRFDFNVPRAEFRALISQLPYVVLLQFVALFICGVYAFIWRYVGMREIGAFALAAAGSVVPVIVLRLTLPSSWHEYRVPLSVAVIDTLIAFAGVFALRVGRRAWFERAQREQRRALGGARSRALLVGAGSAGVVAAREIANRADGELEVHGFIDDDRGKVGSRIQGLRVLGTTEDLPKLAKEMEIDQVVVTIADLPRQELTRIVRICEQIPVPVRIIPGMSDLLEGRVEVSRLRNVEIEDLLGREQVKLDTDEIGAFLGGKVVMVTGAGGSIGAELARQASRFAPKRMVLVERAEFVLFEIDRELRMAFPELLIEAMVGDVGDEGRMKALLEDVRPHVVIHAAAHKHVPLMETNAGEAVKNNVMATETVARLSGECGAEAFVLISTDKAVNPTSVMGATKRVAELVTQDMGARFPKTRFVVVRFGNVMGSTGSVIPIFREQIKKGGPVTVTHPEMMRYFMTIPEASQLVLQAGAMGKGGEIFVLDMGEPVKIVDLAREMIRLSGFVPDEDIEIIFSGMRPGEKLFEEIGMDHEGMTKTKHPKIFIGDLKPMESGELVEALERLGEVAGNGEAARVREALSGIVKEATLE